MENLKDVLGVELLGLVILVNIGFFLGFGVIELLLFVMGYSRFGEGEK